MAECIEVSETHSPRRIKKLDEAVINRIAAGEVIQRPANALKEMIENSLDAGATSIQITTKNGGLKMLQIQDNGSGIKKEDMSIVCERFTTSKLETFEDLSSIRTYGFRGEALASISHIAHVTITTRTSNDKCSYKACYSDGKLIPQRPGANPEPRPSAGNQGTLIHVEDLFYNMPTRQKALKNPSEEYHKIVDVVGKYAIHNAGVSFNVKKYGESSVDVRTTQDMSVTDNIGAIYGQSVARELLSISCDDNKFGFKMTGYVTNANYSVKKLHFLLFINHRLVDCSSLRKSIESVYSAYLPKNTHPFVYMSIEVLPRNVDVNVHPTKHEVHFLHEDKIIETIQQCIEDKLLGCNNSRTYYTQTLLPGISVSSSLEENTTSKNSESRVYAHQMVRTDSKEQKLEAFLHPSSQEQDMEKEKDADKDFCDGQSSGKKCKRKSSLTIIQRKRGHHKPVHLTSVNKLLQKIRNNKHQELSSLFNEHKFVGCVDQTRALIQYQTKLYLINLTKVTQELFYQLVLLDFANFGTIKLNPPAPIYELAMLGLESPDSGWTPEDGPKESLAQYLVDFYKTKSDMLEDYFSLKISDDGCIVSLPLLLESYSPNLDRLPMFLLRLVSEVDWETEQDCFNGIATECSLFYCIQNDPFLIDSKQDENMEERTFDAALQKQSPWRWVMEHVLFPALRVDLIPPKEMADDGSILQIADLHELYKVFERC